MRSGIGLAVMARYGREVYGVEPAAYPHAGSGIVSFDFGNPWASPGNHPPEDDLPDPHGLPLGMPHADEQAVVFWETGEITDTCGGDGCHPE